jgi:hypothetical protein
MLHGQLPCLSHRYHCPLVCDARHGPPVNQPKTNLPIEPLRRQLEEAKGHQQFSLTRCIEWLGRAANHAPGPSSSLAFRVYHYALNLQPWGTRPPSIPQQELYARVEREADPAVLVQLQTALSIPKSAAVRVLARCPAAGELSLSDIACRLIELKGVLPGLDVARIVELLPSAFLGPDWERIPQRVHISATLLTRCLPGADVNQMIEEDPTILFEDEESLRTGLLRLRELWDVGPDTFRNSDPLELALAVRALGLKGPPTNV